MTCIETHDDIRVGEPLERETIREVSEGILVTCRAIHCEWQGLFPGPKHAKDAVEMHWERCNRQRVGYHYGDQEYTIVKLLDDRRAVALDESAISPTDDRVRRATREPAFPRSTGAVDEIVTRGDQIEFDRHPYEGIVYRVVETRSLGLPTWTVIYVDADTDLDDVRRSDKRWLNESIAQDDTVYCRYGEEFLGEPLFEVVGEVEHQADLKRFNRGASA